MALRDLVFINNPLLREKSKKVKKFGPELKKLADDMLETMHANSGVGLAAPQVGVLQRLIVAQEPPEEEGAEWGKPYVLVNPEVIEASDEMVEGEEGCLSVPTWYGLVKRPSSVTVKAKDVQGKNIRFRAEGYLARIISHEIDHLHGVLFVDHIVDADKIWQVLPGEEQPQEEADAADTEDTAGESTREETVPV